MVRNSILHARPRAILLVENLPVPLDRRVWQEARALHADGWDVTVIGPRGPGTMRGLRANLEGIEVLRYPQRAATGLAGYLIEYAPSMLFTTAWVLWARLRGPIRVIHGCNPPDLFWLIGLLGRVWGAAYVFDQHDANPELAMTKWSERRGLAKALLRLTFWLERRSYRAAALVLAPNESYRDLALERGRLNPNDVIVVRNAPDVDAYRRLAQGVKGRPRRVGYVGVMGSQDGLDVLLDAWRIVQHEPDMRDAVLELVGDGESRSTLQAQARRLGLSGSVNFHGYLPPPAFVPILAACTVCVSPDPPTPFNSVSTMVKVIDYLAIGKGLVAFDLAETRRVAGDAALIAKNPSARSLADTLLDVLRDPASARALEDSTQERVDSLELDWQVSAKKLTAAYTRFKGNAQRGDGADRANGWDGLR